MTTAAHLLTSGDTTNTSVFTTSSIAPGANRLVLFFGISSGSNPAPNGVATGLGLTWSTPSPVNAGAKTQWMSWAVTGGSAPTPGALTITHGSSINGLAYSVVEVDDVDTANPIVQANHERSTSNSQTITLGSAPTAGNATVAMFWNQNANAITPSTYTELGEASHSAPLTGIETSWSQTATQSATATWASSSAGGGILVEVKAAPAASGGEGTAAGSFGFEGVALGRISQPTYVSKSSANHESSTSLTISAPAGVQSGMRQFVVLTFNSGDEPTNNTPSGWTQILAYDNPHASGGQGENERVEVWTSTTDTGAVTFTKGGSVIRWYGLRTAYAGVSDIAGLASQPQNGSLTRDTTHPIPSQTTTVAKSMVLSFLTSETDIGETWTSPAGWTERHNANVGSAGLDPLHISVVDRVEATPTTVSGHSFTSGGNEWSTIGSLRLLPVVAQGTVSGTWTFTGGSVGKRTPKGTVTGTLAYVGSAIGKRTPKGSVTGTLAYVGSVVGKRSPKGSATGTWTFAGSASGKRPAKGSTIGTWAFAGTASGKRAPKGTIAGTWAFAGMAVGQRTPEGAAAGTWAFAGSATGTAPAVQMNEGSAAGTTNWTGSAVGTTARRGNAAGNLAFTGSASGTVARRGTVGGTFVFVSAAVGATTRRGTASGVLSFVGTASGVSPSAAYAIGNWSFSGMASGHRAPEAAASGVWGFDGAASGSSPHGGTAGGSTAFSGSASGKRVARATVSGTLSYAGSATGERDPKGSASGSVLWSGTALGNAPEPGQSSGASTGQVLWSGSAVGERPKRGSASGTVAWDGSATGYRAPRGSASGSFVYSGAAVGRRAATGGVVGTFSYVGTAAGTTLLTGYTLGLTEWVGMALGEQNVVIVGEFVVGPPRPPRYVAATVLPDPITVGPPHPEPPERYRSDEPRPSRFSSGGAG